MSDHELDATEQQSVRTRLRDFASQECCDGEPYDTMQEASDYIQILEMENAKLEAVIQKMIEAWDNNDRSEYQTIIQQMEEYCEQRFSARDIQGTSASKET